MLLYTSGATSGSPRGVTLSHSILGRQVRFHILFCSRYHPHEGLYPRYLKIELPNCLKDIFHIQIERVVDAWDWNQEDSVLHCLSLGSTYGLINSLQVLLIMINSYLHFPPVALSTHYRSYLSIIIHTYLLK